MMNVMFALIAKRVFSDILEGVSSKDFSLALLACLRPPFFKLLAYTIYSFYGLRGGQLFPKA